MSRHLITVRRRRKASRAKKARREAREQRAMVGVYNPAAGQVGRIPADEARPPGLSKTQVKKVAVREKFVQERAERKLQGLDFKWGLGLGPIKARLKWMAQLFGGGR